MNDKLRICGIGCPSTIDYYGKVSMVVFCGGCNFKCGYCHNAGLIPRDSGEDVDLEYFRDKLEKEKYIIDSVVFTGGEPTLQPKGIIAFAGLAKNMGFKVMLDTNGSN